MPLPPALGFRLLGLLLLLPALLLLFSLLLLACVFDLGLECVLPRLFAVQDDLSHLLCEALHYTFLIILIYQPTVQHAA